MSAKKAVYEKYPRRLFTLPPGLNSRLAFYLVKTGANFSQLVVRLLSEFLAKEGF